MKKIKRAQDAEIIQSLYRDLYARDEEIAELEEEIEHLKELLRFKNKRLEYFEGKKGKRSDKQD